MKVGSALDSIGLRIKDQRKRLGFSQDRFALDMELSLEMIKSLEQGRAKPSIETLMKLTNIFNCSADYLLGTDSNNKIFSDESSEHDDGNRVNRFAEQLKFMREQCNLTRKDVAERLGISQPYYGKFEKGVAQPSIETLAKMSEMLKCTVDFLLGINQDDEIISTHTIEHEDLIITTTIKKKPPISSQEV